MISLEQVRALETRVEKAVALITSLRAENATLKDGLIEADLRTEAAEARTLELEALIKEFQKDQERIEEGIVQALRKLDVFEDAVQAAVRPVPAQTPVPAPVPERSGGSVEPPEQSSTSVNVETGVPDSDQSDGLDIF